jgi:hypothetical protein
LSIIKTSKTPAGAAVGTLGPEYKEWVG